MAELELKQDDPVLQWVTFQLEDETYGIDVMVVREVLKYQDIAPVPGAPDYVMGIINIRGTVISVINTRLRFGLSEKEPEENTRIVILEIGQHIIGIVVDSVAEVVYMKRSEIESAPQVNKDDSARFIQGVCHRDDQLIILVELDKLLSEEELRELDN
jgi:purine-binding chemotaxis protein CheW